MSQNNPLEASNTSNNTKNNPSVSEIRKWYEENKNNLQKFENATKALKQLRDTNKTSTKTISAFNKNTLKTYLQNIGTNENNLKNLSVYLYYRSHIYFRLIKFYANMFCLYARKIVPNYDLTKENDKSKFLKSYNETLDALDRMNLQSEMIKVYTQCFREDVSYNLFFSDETGSFVYNLPSNYCRIDSQYYTGDFGFSMDMTYWRNRQDELEFLGSPLTEMYQEYQSTGVKWIHCADEYALCMKFRSDDWQLSIPPFSGMFLDLVSLLDLSDIQAIADEQQIYKMIWMELETISNTKDIDDFKIDPDLAMDYFNRMLEALPDYASAAIVPGKLEQINFNNDASTDVNKVAKATETVLNTAGAAEVLNGASISSSAAFNAAMKANTEFAISTLLPQTQSFVNRWITYQVKNPAKVSFFPVSVYTIDDFKKNLLEGGQYGMPNQLAYNTLNGVTEKETLALNFLEQDCLDLKDRFVPMSSSYVQSGGTIGEGRDKIPDNQLTEEGEKTRNK